MMICPAHLLNKICDNSLVLSQTKIKIKTNWSTSYVLTARDKNSYKSPGKKP